MTLGERIKSYRKAEGLSQEALAEKLRVSRQAITKWENDNGVPDIDNLIVLSKLMGITLDELVLGESKECDSAVDQGIRKQRKRTREGYLLVAILFSVAAIIWIIACYTNKVNGNETGTILSALCALLQCVPIGIYWSKYFEMRE